MIPLEVTPDIDRNPWTEMLEKKSLPGLGLIVKIGRLPNGTTSGESVVMIEIETPGGLLVVGQTTLALLKSAIKTINAAEEDPGKN